MAWLHATPKAPAGTKRAKIQDEQALISRLDRMKADGVPIQLPPNPSPVIVNQLIEIGLTEAAGMGSGPLSWRTIGDWQREMGVDLPPWQKRMIRRLSTEYLAFSRKAEVETCPAPWHAEVTQREIDIEGDRLRALLGRN